MEQFNKKRKNSNYFDDISINNSNNTINKKAKTVDINYINNRIDKIEYSIDKLLIYVQNIDTSLKYITKNIKKDDLNLDSIRKIVDDIEIKSSLLDEKFYGSQNNNDMFIDKNNSKKENDSYFN